MDPIRSATQSLGPIRFTRALTGATLGAYANALRVAAGLAAIAADRLRPPEPVALPGPFLDEPPTTPTQRRRARSDEDLVAIAAGSVRAAREQLQDLTSDELARLHDLELAGQARETLLDAIEDTLLSP